MTRRSSFHSLNVALLTIVLLWGCASENIRSDLEKGHALAASGRVADAYQTLQQASAAHPDSAELREAANASRDQYGNFLAQRAEAALADQRMEEAASLYRQLVALPGFESKGQDGLNRLATRPQVAVPVAVKTVPAVIAAPVTPLPESKPVTEAVPAQVPAATVKTPAVATVAKSVAGAKAVPSKSISPQEDPLLKRVTLEFRDASVRSLFDAVTHASGLNVIFDRDIPPDLKTTVFLRNTTVKAALDKIVLTSGLAWRSLDENTLLVYTDDVNKQHDYQALAIRSFQLSNADAKFVANSLKTVLKFHEVVVDEKLNMIIVRDTPEAIAMAEKLVAMHDMPEPEVMLEVTILEISKGKLESLGVAWPGSMSLTPLARTVSTTTSTTDTTSGYVSSSSNNTLTLRDLYNLTPASLGMTLGSTTVNFSATDSDVNVLANPRIRTRNREKAKVMIGERVPQLASNTTSTGVVSQNVTYIDVGIKLDVEPQIFPGNEIGLKLGLEVSSINGTEKNGTTVAYRIGTRNATTMLRLKDGENQVLAGLIQDSDKKSVSKVPLLGDIPILGRLFRSDSTDKSKTEIVLSITPRLIRGNNLMSPEAARFDSGTYSSVRGRRNEGDNPVSAEVPAQQNTSPVQPAASSDAQRQSIDGSARQFGGSRD
ncbi:MAG: hypothetical protein H6R19_1831 [Proteobacteria bacterium]|nr:hypothetical protein [Pseudomonadota bacterium]